MSNVYMKDLYPNMGIMETSTDVQPDPEDINTLADDGETAQNINTVGTPHKIKLFAVIAVLIGVAFLGSLAER